MSKNKAHHEQIVHTAVQGRYKVEVASNYASECPVPVDAILHHSFGSVPSEGAEIKVVLNEATSETPKKTLNFDHPKQAVIGDLFQNITIRKHSIYSTWINRSNGNAVFILFYAAMKCEHLKAEQKVK